MGCAYYILTVFFCLLQLSHGDTDRPVVRCNHGVFRGLRATDGDYSMYLGIPYAVVNPYNPFGLSKPHPGFKYIYDAIDDSVLCPQREEFNKTLVGSIDCLRINVFVPNSASSKKRLPVLVNLHGGGFAFGIGGRYQHNPKFIVRHDVIVVTLNYRVGIYGFMCLDTPEVPGNQGLKDQLHALRWVKNNIEAFGGDSKKITLSGQSAGGISADLHLSYLNEDLFRNVIIQSGTSLFAFAFKDSDPKTALKLAAKIGYKARSTSDALGFLATVNSTDVVAAAEGFITPLLCVEKKHRNVDRYIYDHPLVVDVKAKNVSVLIGNNNDEMAYMLADDKLLEGTFREFALLDDIFDFKNTYGARQQKLVRQFYIGDQNMSKAVQRQLIDMRNDFVFYYPTYRRMQKYLESFEERKVYSYIFSYDGGRNFMKLKNNVTNMPGALHVDDLAYLFDMSVVVRGPPNKEDQLTIDRVTTMWTNFVKYSNPTPMITEILPVQWPPVSKDVKDCLDIDYNLTVQRRPFHDRMAFWDLFYQHNWAYINRRK